MGSGPGQKLKRGNQRLMETLLYILSFLWLIIITLQDFKYRAISWVLIPLLFFSTGIKAIYSLESETVQSAVISNSLFIIAQISILILYFSIKTGKLNFIIDKYIGTGDVLFFFAITPVFCLGNFILFIVVSLLLVILFYFVLSQVKKNFNPQIPLAGIQSIFLIGWFLFEIFIDPTLSHQYLLNYLVN